MLFICGQTTVANPYFKQTDPQYKLRWSESLRDKVMSSAKENNRSINQEIIARLEKSFDNESYPPVTQTDRDYLAKIQAIEEKLNVLINNTSDVLGNKKAP